MRQYGSTLLITLLAWGTLPMHLDAQSALNALMAAVPDQVVTNPDPVSRAAIGTQGSVLIARFNSFVVGDQALPFVFQVDDSLAHPLARVGDTLYALNRENGQNVSVQVVEVHALKGVCGDQWEQSGWAYHLDTPLEQLLDIDEDGYYGVMPDNILFLSHRFVPAPAATPPPPVIAAITKAHSEEMQRLEREARESHKEWLASDPAAEQHLMEGLYGESSPDAFSADVLRTLRREGQPIYALGYSGASPLDSEAVPDPYTIIFDSEGREIGRVDGDVRKGQIGDMTGDTTDEVILPETGEVVAFRDGEWWSSSRDQFYYPPCKY